MATMTVSISDPIKDWIDEQVRSGGYASSDDYLNDLVMRERLRQGEELSVEELRQMVAASRESGIGTRGVDEIFAEAEKIVALRKARRA
ncbi:type II toxin-antitoxin system ParD family antitoxin [Rhizobium sp. XQZ8]|uniref:ribbon-helix-helix domain-containing protein n=1 Tax=Rhizobium populisoli TaxID=2859785 RepID=UPI001CA4E87F|nr:type II toxin-antitoxin system ParD family antitoxin [Rhizobium populisoli]MBW6421736.1 type II toxin-antitoxin system ParD family antitoxin [Rhizobium populisoli]